MPASLKAWSSRTFSALQHHNFRRYWLSQLLSLVGSWMQTTAQQYLVLELSHGSSAALGMVTVTQFLPSLLLSLVAGAVIDRLPRRRVLLTTQIVLLACSATLAISTHLGVVTLPLVMVTAFVTGTANAFDMPARQSMVVDFVPRQSVPNAVALNSLSFNASRTVGQALFGIVAALGASLFTAGNEKSVAHLALPFYLNVVSFFYVIYVISTLPFPPREPHLRSSMADDVREGLSYVKNTPAIRNVMVLIGLMSLTVINFNVILPYFARVVYGAQEATFGLLSAAFGIGAMAGALWQASRPNPLQNLRRGSLILLASTLLLALVPGPVLAAPVLMACGFGQLSLLVSANSTVQLSVPDELRGRVMSLYSFVLVGMGPLGAIISSWLINKQGRLGSHLGLIVLDGLGLLSVLALWTRLPRALPTANAPATAAEKAAQR